jgi:hypothetical protein
VTATTPSTAARLPIRIAIAAFVAIAVLLGFIATRSSGHSPRRLPALAVAGRASAAQAASAADSAMAPAGLVEYRYAASGIRLPTSARAMRLPPTDVEPAAARVARALGVARAELTIDEAAGQPWHYGGDQSVSVSSGCAVASPPAPPAAPDQPPPADQPSSETKPSGPTPTCDAPPRPEGMPTRDEAERVARAALARAGLTSSDVTAEVSDGNSSWFVVLTAHLAGRPAIGWTWTAQVGPHGKVLSASGFLAAPTDGDEYPLIGEAAALARLNTGDGRELRMGVPAIAQDVDLDGCRTGATCAPAQPMVRTVTGVQLAFLFAPWASGDGAELVPAFLFTSDDGSTIPVVALPDEFLTPPPAVTPDSGGKTEPGGPPQQIDPAPPAPPASSGGSAGTVGGAPTVR